MKIKTRIIIFLSAIGMAACTPQITITQDQLFQGYPCLDNCGNFQTGFKTAQDKNFKEDSNCQTLPESNRLGCLTYMHEYHLLHNQPQGYNF